MRCMRLHQNKYKKLKTKIEKDIFEIISFGKITY